MKPILFSVFGINIYSYGLMMAIGIVSAYLVADYRAKKRGLDTDFLFKLAFGAIIFGFLGAKVLYWITILDKLIADFWNTFKNSITSGFVVYGSIIFGFGFALLYCYKKRKNILEYFDICAPSIALGQGFGRIGCFLAGCCYGVETDSFIGVNFPSGSYAPSGIKLIPTQLISSILNFINFIILLFAAKKLKKPGQVLALYLMNYGVGRFIIEFFRDDYRGAVGFLSTSQFISIFFIVAGIILMFFTDKIYNFVNKLKDKKNKNKNE